MELSKKIQNQGEEYNMTCEELAFATLVNSGWTVFDAITILKMLPDKASTSSVRGKADKIQSKPGYRLYLTTLGAEDDITIDTGFKRRGGKKLRDKDAVLKEMEKEAGELSGLEKIKALKEIAELQQMKKEQTNDKEDLVQFFLPLTCNYCSLFMELMNKDK